MTTALVVLAVLLLVGGLVYVVARLSRQHGSTKASIDAAVLAEEARKVRDEKILETRHLDDAALDERLSRWMRDDRQD